MVDPKQDRPHHPPHPGNYSGRIPDNEAGASSGGRRRITVILAVLVFVIAVGWLMIGGGDTLDDEPLGEPAGVGEAATAVDRDAEEVELPHGAIGEASEASTVLAPEAIDQEAEAEGAVAAE